MIEVKTITVQTLNGNWPFSSREESVEELSRVIESWTNAGWQLTSHQTIPLPYRTTGRGNKGEQHTLIFTREHQEPVRKKVQITGDTDY